MYKFQVSKATSNQPIINMSSITSVFIPRVFINISKERIAKIFDSLDLGIVDKIDFVKKQGPNGAYHAVYVHMKYWLKTTASRQFREKLVSKDGAKLVYEDPWYWVVLPNTADRQKKKSIPGPPKLFRDAKIYPKTVIDFAIGDSKTPISSPSSPKSPPKNANYGANLQAAEDLLASIQPKKLESEIELEVEAIAAALEDGEVAE